MDISSKSRTGQDQGYNVLLSDHLQKPGFNVTQPRFQYGKDDMKRAEIPGPGSYNRLGTQEGRPSPEKMHAHPNQQFGLTANFKDSTSRDDFKSYLAHEKKKAPLAGSDYFQETRPFLKKTFNASLPPPRFI